MIRETDAKTTATAKPTKRNSRPTVSRAHWIIGSMCAVFWLISSFTGAVLAPNPKYGPAPQTHPAVSPADALDAATDATDGNPSMLSLPSADHAGYIVMFRRKGGATRIEI